MPFNCFAVFADYLAKLQQNDTHARTRVVTLRVTCMPVHPSRLVLMSLIRCSMKLRTPARAVLSLSDVSGSNRNFLSKLCFS